jgi:pilus assembly protein CpaF
VRLVGGPVVAVLPVELTAADAEALIDAEVRELLSRGGVDPAVDPAAVRAAISDAIAGYERQRLRSRLPALGDPAALGRRLFDGVAGLGPLQRYLDDPEVEEIWLNSPSRVFIARHGRSELTTTVLTADAVRDLVERMLKPTGRRVDLSHPFVDATLPDGSRLHVAIPDITRAHWAVNIRKFVVRARGVEDLVALGTLTRHAARFLEAAVAAGLNILVAGGTQAGKTTMLNCLCAAIPTRERVVTVEEVFELQVPLPDVVNLQTRQESLEGTGAVDLRQLVKEALRMRPSRLIVGEVRQQECLDLLIALNSGLPGMASIHANSAREAITKTCTLPLLAGDNIGSRFVVPTVAGCIDIVVHLGTDVDGTRRVREIVAVPGRVEGDVVEIEPLFVSRRGRLERADGFPPHLERFEQVGIDIGALLSRSGSISGADTTAPTPVPAHPDGSNGRDH